MMIALLVCLYFIAIVIVYAVNDNILKDWEWLPGYAIYVVVAPVSVPVTFLIYLAYKFYTKLIKPRINK